MSTSDNSSMVSSPSWFRLPRRRRVSRPVFVLMLTAGLAVSGLIVAKRWWVDQQIDGLVYDHLEGFEAAGLHVGKPKVLNGVAGVKQAVEVDVDGIPVKILEFDLNEQSQSQELERIHRDRSTCVLGAAMPAEDNGPIVIVDHEKHPSKDKLLECFRSRRVKSESGNP